MTTFVSYTDIARFALSYARMGGKLTDVATDEGQLAGAIRDLTPFAVDSVQRVAHWPEYAERAKLVKLAEQPDDTGTYYATPQGAAMITAITPHNSACYCRFQRKIDLAKGMPTYIAELIALQIAQGLARSIANDNNLSTGIVQQYELTLVKAINFAAKQQRVGADENRLDYDVRSLGVFLPKRQPDELQTYMLAGASW